MKTATIRSFRKQLRRFERLLNGQLKDYCCGVTLGQCHTLLEIEEQGKTTIVNLTKILDLDKSTLSRTIDGLVNIGLVKRVPHPSDRRYTQLDLTKQGKDICKRLNKENDNYFKRVFQMIPSEEHDGVIEHFEILVQGFSKLEERQ